MTWKDVFEELSEDSSKIDKLLKKLLIMDDFRDQFDRKSKSGKSYDQEMEVLINVLRSCVADYKHNKVFEDFSNKYRLEETKKAFDKFKDSFTKLEESFGFIKDLEESYGKSNECVDYLDAYMDHFANTFNDLSGAKKPISKKKYEGMYQSFLIDSFLREMPESFYVAGFTKVFNFIVAGDHDIINTKVSSDLDSNYISERKRIIGKSL